MLFLVHKMINELWLSNLFQGDLPHGCYLLTLLTLPRYESIICESLTVILVVCCYFYFILQDPAVELPMTDFISKFSRATAKLSGVLSQNPEASPLTAPQDLIKLCDEIEKYSDFYTSITEYMARNQGRKLQVSFFTSLFEPLLTVPHSMFRFRD